MSARTRRATVRAPAKINLDLRVLGPRADGYHELRTVFQTVGLADRIELAYTPGSRAEIELDDPLGLPDNLLVRAARAAMDALGITGRLEMRLEKRIPMGAGLGGGSSDAAAVLLALPALAGKRPDLACLWRIGAQLGSDVPFFLLGGRAVGMGRGTEMYPLTDTAERQAILAAPGVHVSTAEAYRLLAPRLTTESQQNKIFSFESRIWDRGCLTPPENDFEAVVFLQHPVLAAWKGRLIEAGASVAMMTGSGSALFGLFQTRREAEKGLAELRKYSKEGRVHRVSLIGRARYRAQWWRELGAHITGRTWPPRSRYLR